MRTTKPRSRPFILASFATMCAAVALVIWIKLRVVTTIPRQAVATPENRVVEPRPARPAAADAAPDRFAVPAARDQDR